MKNSRPFITISTEKWNWRVTQGGTIRHMDVCKSTPLNQSVQSIDTLADLPPFSAKGPWLQREVDRGKIFFFDSAAVVQLASLAITQILAACAGWKMFSSDFSSDESIDTVYCNISGLEKFIDNIKLKKLKCNGI